MTKITYLVTDPCYIIDNEVWDDICGQCTDDDFYNGKFNKLVADHLTEITGQQAYASETGFGDWSNKLLGETINDGEFVADAGMVSVCKLDAALLSKYTPEQIKNLGAIFEAEGEIEVSFDDSDSDWTIVNIVDQAGNCWNSLPPENFDDEEDEEDEDEEDEDED